MDWLHSDYYMRKFIMLNEKLNEKKNTPGSQQETAIQSLQASSGAQSSKEQPEATFTYVEIVAAGEAKKTSEELQGEEKAALPPNEATHFSEAEFWMHGFPYTAKDGTKCTRNDDKYDIVEIQTRVHDLHAFIAIPEDLPGSEPSQLTEKKIIISFRGTHSRSAWVRNLEGKAAGSISYQKASDSLKIAIKKVYERYPAAKFSLTIGGHSLGGADAQRMMTDIMEEVAKDKADNNHFKRTKKIDLFVFNAAGVSEDTAKRAKAAAEKIKINTKLKANFLISAGDPVQQTGYYIFNDTPHNIAHVTVLKATHKLLTGSWTNTFSPTEAFNAACSILMVHTAFFFASSNRTPAGDQFEFHDSQNTQDVIKLQCRLSKKWPMQHAAIPSFVKQCLKILTEAACTKVYYDPMIRAAESVGPTVFPWERPTESIEPGTTTVPTPTPLTTMNSFSVEISPDPLSGDTDDEETEDDERETPEEGTNSPSSLSSEQGGTPDLLDTELPESEEEDSIVDIYQHKSWAINTDEEQKNKSHTSLSPGNSGAPDLLDTELSASEEEKSILDLDQAGSRVIHTDEEDDDDSILDLNEDGSWVIYTDEEEDEEEREQDTVIIYAEAIPQEPIRTLGSDWAICSATIGAVGGWETAIGLGLLSTTAKVHIGVLVLSATGAAGLLVLAGALVGLAIFAVAKHFYDKKHRKDSPSVSSSASFFVKPPATDAPPPQKGRRAALSNNIT